MVVSIIYQPADIIGDGRYQVMRLIGEGGAAIVYQAQDMVNHNPVAIKVLRPELLDDNEQIAIFKQEAQLALSLQHQNIVTTYEINTEKWQNKNIYFLVMEYLPGGTLIEQIKIKPSLAQAISWIKQLLGAINYAHESGVIHLDIKSANVFLSGTGEVKIGDFGLARITSNAHLESGLSMPELTQNTQQKKGTPAYMSPELCYGETQDERSDIYSLGVLFFEMLTGQMPFEAKGMIELARQHVSKPVPSMRSVNPDIPEALDKIVNRMMAKDKDARFQSAKQVLMALEFEAI